MFFKPNPKALVEHKFIELFGSGHDYSITGTRLSPLACKNHGVPTGTYSVELFVGDKLIAAARHRDWRTAYKLLKIEVEKLYSEGFALVQSSRPAR